MDGRMDGVTQPDLSSGISLFFQIDSYCKTRWSLFVWLTILTTTRYQPVHKYTTCKAGSSGSSVSYAETSRFFSGSFRDKKGSWLLIFEARALVSLL